MITLTGSTFGRLTAIGEHSFHEGAMIAARPYDSDADSRMCWREAIAFQRRVLELRALYGLLPSEAKALALREAAS